jgi:hypothetical protein
MAFCYAPSCWDRDVTCAHISHPPRRSTPWQEVSSSREAKHCVRNKPIPFESMIWWRQESTAPDPASRVNIDPLSQAKPTWQQTNSEIDRDVVRLRYARTGCMARVATLLLGRASEILKLATILSWVCVSSFLEMKKISKCRTSRKHGFRSELPRALGHLQGGDAFRTRKMVARVRLRRAADTKLVLFDCASVCAWDASSGAKYLRELECFKQKK